MSSQKLSLPPTLSLPRAAVYMRSATCDDDRFYTIEQQTRLLAQQEGYDLVALYSDVSSGWRSVEKRTGLKEMFAAARAGLFSVLYLQDLSRLSRDPEEVRRLLQEIKTAGVLEVKFFSQPTLMATILTLPFLARLFDESIPLPHQGEGGAPKRGVNQIQVLNLGGNEDVDTRNL